MIQTEENKNKPGPKVTLAPIGRRIKERRKELGLTLEQLAKTSGLSAPFISQAERDKTVPSLVSLTALAQALVVDVTYFIEIPQTEGIVTRADERPKISIKSDVEYFNLSSELPERKMEAVLMVIPAGHHFPVDHRDGEDFWFVLEGELYAEAGDTKVTLKPGDSMHFDSRLAHSAHNRSEQPVKLLYVGTPVIF